MPLRPCTVLCCWVAHTVPTAAACGQNLACSPLDSILRCAVEYHTSVDCDVKYALNQYTAWTPMVAACRLMCLAHASRVTPRWTEGRPRPLGSPVQRLRPEQRQTMPQVQLEPIRRVSGGAAGQLAPKYTGMLQAVRTIVREEGVLV